MFHHHVRGDEIETLISKRQLVSVRLDAPCCLMLLLQILPTGIHADKWIVGKLGFQLLESTAQQALSTTEVEPTNSGLQTITNPLPKDFLIPCEMRQIRRCNFAVMSCPKNSEYITASSARNGELPEWRALCIRKSLESRKKTP